MRTSDGRLQQHAHPQVQTCSQAACPEPSGDSNPQRLEQYETTLPLSQEACLVVNIKRMNSHNWDSVAELITYRRCCLTVACEERGIKSTTGISNGIAPHCHATNYSPTGHGNSRSCVCFAIKLAETCWNCINTTQHGQFTEQSACYRLSSPALCISLLRNTDILHFYDFFFRVTL